MSILQDSVHTVNGAVCRPWGSYLVVDEGIGHKTKRLTVSAGCRLSYHRHQHRAEHWFVVSGVADATIEGDIVRLVEGNSLDIPSGCAHRVANTGAEELVLVEVQTRVYLGEDDIQRLADDYGRAPG
jgi:mannose-6-phosphate isomerase